MLEGFFDQMGQWPVSQAIGASIWIYPTIQAIHLVFLALFAGGMMITDLRLLGFGMRSKTDGGSGSGCAPVDGDRIPRSGGDRASSVDAERLA